MKIEMPLPNKNLMPNAARRLHYMKRASMAKKLRRDAGYMALHAMNELGIDKPRWKKATVQCTFYFRDLQRRDPDGCASMMKAAFDGFTDAGVWVDDQYVMHLPVVIDYDKADPRVEIEVLEIN